MEYRCSACKKAIQTAVIQCKSCVKMFYHPGCVSKHKIYDRNNELMQCHGLFEKFMIESNNGEGAKKTTGSNRDDLGSTGASGRPSTSVSGSPSMDAKIDWLVKTVKKIKTMMKDIIQHEIKSVKEELEKVRRMLTIGPNNSSRRAQKSFSEIVKEKKKENVIIVKPKIQQENVDTAMLIKKKVDIKNMEMGVTKIRRGSHGTVILGCKTGEEIAKLKTTVQNKLITLTRVIKSL